jgi:Flp pilus assembly protein CpaB
MKTKSIILIAISLGFGLVAAIGMTQVMGRSKKSNDVEDVKDVMVYVAKNDIDNRQVINAENVVLKPFRPTDVPEGVATQADKIIDMRTTRIVTKGNFIQTQYLIDKYKTGGDIEIPKGYTVYSVKPSLESTIYNMLRPGDRIDIIGIMRNPKNNQQVSKTFLKNIRIFGINDQTHRQTTEEQINIQLVQVLLRPKQAELLALVQSSGKIQFVLRPDDDTMVDIEGDDVLDEASDDSVSLSIFFGDNSPPPTPEATGELLRLQQDAIARAHASTSEKPFLVTYWSPTGPVQYEFKDRTSLPVKKTGVSDAFDLSAIEDTNEDGSLDGPKTFAPADGQTGEGSASANNADSSEDEEIIEPATRAKEAESK